MLGLLACACVNAIHSGILVSALEVSPARGIGVAISNATVSTLEMGLDLEEGSLSPNRQVINRDIDSTAHVSSPRNLTCARAM
jgi:hypothetical protein